MGRPTKYSVRRVNKILAAINALKGRVQAAKEGGIHYTTLLEWINVFPEFSDAVKKAEEEAEVKGKEFAIMSIFSAMKNGRWQAAAWWLERNFSEEYSIRERHDHSHKIEWIEEKTYIEDNEADTETDEGD